MKNLLFTFLMAAVITASLSIKPTLASPKLIGSVDVVVDTDNAEAHNTDSDNDITGFAIYTSMGSLVLSTTSCNWDFCELGISSLDPGTYVAKVFLESGSYSEQFIIN